MKTHQTTTTENTAALIEEFFDGFNLPVHRDGDTLHVRDDKETEISILGIMPIEDLSAILLAIVGDTEENRIDLELLLDRWDFSEEA